MNEYLHNRYRLVYRLRIISGVWIRNEGSTSTVSEDYIPGASVRQAFRDAFCMSADETLRFTFTYLCLGKKRGIPSPVSLSYLRNDHTQIRDWMSDGRRPDDYDRERILWRCYIDNPGADIMISNSVSEKAVDIGGKNIFAIAPGQLFSGSIEGSEDEIHALAALCTKKTKLKIGAGQDSGLGICEIESVYTEKTPESPKNELEEFVVHLNSPLPMFTPSGLYDERPETILSEIERILGCPSGGLYLADVCRRTDTFYRRNQPVALCTDKGSCLRIRSKTGPVDISPVASAWIGAFSKDGYGEITAEAVAVNHYRKMLVLGEDI